MYMKVSVLVENISVANLREYVKTGMKMVLGEIAQDFGMWYWVDGLDLSSGRTRIEVEMIMIWSYYMS